jgi:hypothetical protein
LEELEVWSVVTAKDHNAFSGGIKVLALFLVLLILAFFCLRPELHPHAHLVDGTWHPWLIGRVFHQAPADLLIQQRLASPGAQESKSHLCK